ncbi:MAG TPA: CHASE domain-containing protein, partial [Kofleriaceae bacterium]|nr:CHASE domain-containing protein [Kofleriaceae bacterium]
MASARRVPWAVSAAVLALGLIGTAALWELRAHRERDELREDVAQRSIGLARMVEQRFNAPAEMMHAVASLISATGDARADAFGRFVRDAIRREPLIYAIEWAPRVTREARAVFEADARAGGIDGYEIRDSAGGKLVRAGDRDVYFPLRYLEPMNQAWGLDFAHGDMGRVLAQQACATGAAAASQRYQLVEDQPGSYSVYAIEGVWPRGVAPSDPAERCRSLLGYVVLILRIDPIFKDVMRHIDLGELELSVRDMSAEELAGNGTVMGESAAGAASRATGDLVARQRVQFLDRTWEVDVAPRGNAPTAIWLLLLGAGASLLASALVGGGVAWWRLRQRLAQALRLGQYQIEQEIGRGGMGVVFRARHVMLRRDTALKLLAAPAGDEDAMARFEREVQLTAKLTHPNTIQVFDYGRTPDGLFYYAMEYLDGVTLQEVIDHDGEQPIARTIHIIAQAAGALREAHAAGLVHRDLKPGNVMITRRGGIADFVKVLDFGLVKRIGVDALLDAGDSMEIVAPGFSGPRTEVGVVTGTPGYVAPEGLRGFEVDQRADLYALGAVWYALLTGRPPFLAENAAATVHAQMKARPVPIERLRTDLPAGLGSLVLRCMNPDPRLRIASAQALLDEIAALAIAPWTQAEAERWWKERAPSVLAAHRAAVAK